MLAPPPTGNPGSAPVYNFLTRTKEDEYSLFGYPKFTESYDLMGITDNEE